ncbi:MAG: SMP-30/gluconolactonase/LRE family protein [Phycisphaeraceae bacterium]|nr:SMP-30/gluconolactonase/LRE family protein [Phycisphaeraceae bacterium]
MKRLLATLLLVTFATLSIQAQLVPKDAVPEKVADGYKFTEGPALGPDGCIYFTDIPNSHILRFDPQVDKTEVFDDKSNRSNGLMFDANGTLYACMQGSRTIGTAHKLENGATVYKGVLQGRYEGKKLNSPNDLVIDKAGNIYFTDPRYGNRDDMEMEIEGVYFQSMEPDEIKEFAINEKGKLVETITPVAKPLVRIDDKLTRPNGIILSPDESILYVADNGANYIYAYDIESPGKVENKRVFGRINDGKGGGSDGMCVDKRGRLYATGHGRVWVFEPTGQPVATIAVGKQTTNCTFGADGKTLYVTANKGLYRITLNTDAPLEHAKEK